MPEHAAPAFDAEVLRQNDAFYRAFSDGDFDAMRALWAEGVTITCVHPLSPALVGRKAVLESWRQILGSGPRLAMRCDNPIVNIVGDTAVVLCYEGNGTRPAHLAATNVFIRQGGQWRMIHHQAGPLERPLAKPAPSSLN